MRHVSWVVFAGLAVALSSSATLVRGDGALPVRFRVSVNDESRATKADHLAGMKVFDWQAGGVVTTGLAGWTCSMGAIGTHSLAGGAGLPASVVQRAQLMCSSASGTVTTTAACALTSDSEMNATDIDLTDATGHRVSIGTLCFNHS